MSLGIWKKLAALLSVICVSIAVNGCGPAAETPSSGDGATAEGTEEGEGTEEETTEEVTEETSEEETEGEGASIE